MARAQPLTETEKEHIILAVKSTFARLDKFYTEVQHLYQKYGFRVPSAGSVARDLSEKIETALIQHCRSFTEGTGTNDLARNGLRWEVKVCKDSGLTINQSAIIDGENYIVVNYGQEDGLFIKKVWVLWHAQDRMFSKRLRNSNARSCNQARSADHIEVLYYWRDAKTTKRAKPRKKAKRAPGRKKKSKKKSA